MWFDVRRRTVVAGLGAGIVGSIAGCTGVDSPGSEEPSRSGERSTAGTEGATRDPWTPEDVSLPVSESELYRAAPRDAIPAITDPVFGPDWGGVSYEISDREGGSFEASPRLAGEDEVLGVVRDGVARAYPLKVLDWHEVVNDAFDQPVAVTYCPVCRSGVVADRRVAGSVRTFGVSGFLFRANLVLYDDGSESLWGQLRAQAIRGPLTGTRMDVLPSTVTTWRAWRETHPGTVVLLPPPFSDTVLGEVRFNYEISLYERTRDIAERYPEYGALGELDWGDARLRRRAIVVGVVHGDEARAYPLSAVTSERVVNDAVGDLPVMVTVGRDRTLHAYDRRVEGETLAFEATDEDDLLQAGGSRWRAGDGVAVDGPHEGVELSVAAERSQLYWAAWLQTHPDSTVYGTD